MAKITVVLEVPDDEVIEVSAGVQTFTGRVCTVAFKDALSEPDAMEIETAVKEELIKQSKPGGMLSKW
ncbi:hypothetical protein KV701_11365 [Limnobaculum sp. M2-1]|uniref:hypothetical protein n=1 Tax=Limnobaculum sp. M2-1 TaxID=2855838 RepID=UPI001C443D4E|nr:hypothetical protein [Limnobaculum sp. M2-1]MBV7692346.1 hypothetical protein [Limnobaculum sp. M2-1]